MAVMQIFRSHIAHMQYVFKTGKAVPFIGGKYYTEVESEIKELEEEIKAGHQFIHRDENQKEIDSELIDPVKQYEAKIRQKILDELKAEQEAAAKRTDMGNSTPDKLTPQHSDDVKSAMAGSTSAVVAPSVQVVGVGIKK